MFKIFGRKDKPPTFKEQMKEYKRAEIEGRSATGIMDTHDLASRTDLAFRTMESEAVLRFTEPVIDEHVNPSFKQWLEVMVPVLDTTNYATACEAEDAEIFILSLENLALIRSSLKGDLTERQERHFLAYALETHAAMRINNSKDGRLLRFLTSQTRTLRVVEAEEKAKKGGLWKR